MKSLEANELEISSLLVKAYEKAHIITLQVDCWVCGAGGGLMNQNKEIDMRVSPAIPVIRVFSEEKAKEFYIDFLGFNLEWEHRFDAGFPLYAQVKRLDLTLHLSEHYGDATPGSTVFVPIDDMDTLYRELTDKAYAYSRPVIEDLPWGRMMQIADPFGNRLQFC